MKKILLRLTAIAGIAIASICSTTAQTITSFSPATGPVGTLITVTGTSLGSPTAFTVGGTTAIVVSNTGTTLVGLVMPGSTTGTVSVSTAGGTGTSVSNFTVTSTPYPVLQQGSKLSGSDVTGAARQGRSVAISADGNTAVVGGFQDNGSTGAAWIYTRSGSTWAQQGSKLVGTGATGSADQGLSVAISADGNTAIVGGYADNSFAGAAWIYTRSGSTWTQQGSKLVGTGATGSAYQGYTVALSADGNTAIVTGYADNSFAGAAWIYTRSAGTWTQEGSKLVGTGATGTAYQGTSVSLSADGNTAIVGGCADNSNAGAVWVYTQSAGVWTQQGNKLVGTGATGAAYQGYSVALSADGNTAIVGGYGDNSKIGAAWVYTRSAGAWTQQGSKLVGTGAIGASYQGYSVALSADGNIAMVGGYQDNSGVGAAWVYRQSAGVWTQQGSKLVGTGASGSAYQGISVGLSADGKTAAVGGFLDNASVGATWVYTAPPAPTITSFSPATGPVGTLIKIIGTNLDYINSIPIGGTSAIVVSTSVTGDTLTGLVMPGTITGSVSIITAGGSATSASNFTVTPTLYPALQQGSKLTGTGNTGASWQGYSAAISADGNTAIVGGDQDNTGIGAAWVYTRSAGVWTQQGSKLVGTGNTGSSLQGYSVAISADGNTALVGGEGDNSGVGGVWIYTRSAGVWTQQGSELIGTGATGNAYQGYSVGLSADGNTALVGGYGDNSFVGAAWVFTRSAGTWTQVGSKLTASDETGTAVMGCSAGLSADGNTAIIGGRADNTSVGAAWVFTYSAGTWTQQGAKLVGTGAVGSASQGASVALSADGNTAIVGGYADNTGEGAAWVYTRSAGTWTQQGTKLAGTGATGASNQGYSAAISADGNTAYVGGYFDNSQVGAAWVFTRSAGTWTQQGTKLIGTGATGKADQGISIAVSADGTTSLVGGYKDNTGIGAAWIYVIPPPTITVQPGTSVQTVCPRVSPTALSVTVTSETGDVITYLWYSNAANSNSGGTSIVTATSNTYTPVTTSAGTLYYYCAVSGAGGSDTSNVSGAITVKSVDILVNQTSNVLTANASGATYQWLNCTSSFSKITGATSQAFTPAANGHYAVSVTQAGCTDTSSCHDVTTTSVNDINSAEADVTVYPMPNDGHFAMNLTGNGYQSLIIYDEIGKQVYTRNIADKTTGNTITLDLSMYSTGIYFARIVTTNGVINKKIVIQ